MNEFNPEEEIQPPKNLEHVNNEWLTTIEAAKLTGYHPDAFRKAGKRGILAFVKRGTQFFFRRIDVMKYAKKMRAMGNAKHTPKKYLREEGWHYD